MSKKISLSLKFLKFTIFPMIVLGIIILCIGTGFFAKSLDDATQESMCDLSKSFMQGLDALYPGAFSAEEKEDGLYLYKGEHMMNMDFDYIDTFREETGYDVTLFSKNFAVITTLTDKDSVRMIGKGEDYESLIPVLEQGVTSYVSDATWAKVKLHAFYTPIYDKDNNIIGMLSLAEPVSMFNKLVRNAVFPLIGLGVLATILGCLYTRLYTRKLIDEIKQVQSYMKSISNGEFRAELNPEVATRDDELGDMARSASKMAVSLRKMVEEDQLTSLLNRRSAKKHLMDSMNNFVGKGYKFCLAMGDIDFFKQVNDTYGHDAGDQVLISVANTMKNYMIGKGYVIRWGGEEFILVFDGIALDEASEKLEELLKSIRKLEILSGDNLIQVTMSFGIVESDPADMDNYVTSDTINEEMLDGMINRRIDEYISEADGRLYYSKQHGRNQITNFDINDPMVC